MKSIFRVSLLLTCFFATATVTSQAADAPNESATGPSEKVATLAGGCFWCTEAVFERMEGVNDVVSGYIGGNTANPTYKQVLTGTTNHAEAVEIYYDPDKVCFEELLSLFFKTHDPTSLNKQGADEGTQYRSSIFYHDDEEKKAAEKYIQSIASDFRRPIVTKLEKAAKFYPAEEYHQDYFRKNPNASYCRAVVAKKVRKANNVLKRKEKDPC
ncbi:MAG: peptide-methionine (S)-S-oxide reductase MsrA [Pirellulaceae bacterium]|nr:peptide-methionine (S)-S-oxide reductase MsrA [Pirellulaceae bacterium]